MAINEQAFEVGRDVTFCPTYQEWRPLEIILAFLLIAFQGCSLTARSHSEGSPMEIARQVASTARNFDGDKSETLNRIFEATKERVSIKQMGGEDLLMIERALTMSVDRVGDDLFAERLTAAGRNAQNAVAWFIADTIDRQEFPQVAAILDQAKPEQTQIAAAYRDPNL